MIFVKRQKNIQLVMRVDEDKSGEKEKNFVRPHGSVSAEVPV